MLDAGADLCRDRAVGAIELGDRAVHLAGVKHFAKWGQMGPNGAEWGRMGNGI